MISLAGLNEKQREAASQIEGPLLILAGAGSGKTRTVTYRIAHMIDNLGISPKNILAVSFTNKAAQEMRERVKNLLSGKKTRGITLSTFHSLGVRILKREIQHLGYNPDFSIYDTNDQLAIVREALNNYKGDKAFDRKAILSKIGNLKNMGISEEEFAESPYLDPDNPYDIATEYVYRYYQDKLLYYNAIDFDDILYMTVKLFRLCPEIADQYSEKYQYIMVDEYQDTNPLQFELVKFLTNRHNNICVVGDDDQSIYAFRGADITNILNFETTYPGAKVVKLEQNYRSTKPIIELANDVIKENKNRKEKRMFCENEDSFKPHIWAMGDTDHEAAVIADEIAKIQAQGKHLADVAILYRSNTQTPPLEDQLILSKVPYQILGGQKFYEKKEVKDVLAYLSVIVNPSDELSLRRVLNLPTRGIGLETLKKYLAIAQEEKLILYEALKKYPEISPRASKGVREFISLIEYYKERFESPPLHAGIASLIDRIELKSYVDRNYDNPKQANRRKEDLDRFIERSESFQKIYGDKPCLELFLERMILADSQDNQEDEEHEVRKNEVQLMTFHSSKGLEFDTVFIVGMEEDILPHKKTILENGDVSEERRLCYVALTRAKLKLYMTYCKQRKQYGKDVLKKPSRFIQSLIEGHCVHQDRTTFDHMSKEEEEQYKKSFFEDLLKELE